MPNSWSASATRAAACGSSLASTKENSPHPPAKSRFHRAWPGSEGNSGQSTRATCGCASSHCATCKAARVCASSRTPIVRRPRAASAASSGETTCPSSCDTRRSAAYQRLPALALPIIRSEWPPTCLERLIITMSQPCSSAAKPRGLAQVLSIIVTAPCSLASAARAGTSVISKVRLPGASSHTAFAPLASSAA